MRTTLTSLVSERMQDVEERLEYNQRKDLPTADLVWMKSTLNLLKEEAIKNNCWEFRNDK